MNRDITLEKLPKGETPYINNGNATEDYGVITNEKGNTEDGNTQIDYYVIGNCLLDDNRQVIFSVAKNSQSGIIQIKDKDVVTDVIPSTPLLNFSLEHQIEAVFKKNYKGEYIVYWTDNYNPPRYLNVSNPPFLTSDTIVTLNIFKSYKRPNFTLNKVGLGGSLKSGVLQYFIQYESKDGAITDCIGASNVVSITPATSGMQVKNYDGAEPGLPTGKSVSMTIYNVDTNYDYINVIAAYYNEGVLETPKIIKKISVTSDTVSFIHNGSENLGTIATSELLSLFAKYNTAKTITLFDNVLYMGNLTDSVDLPLQRYVNNCYVTYNTTGYRLDTPTAFTDETVIYDGRGYMQDDVYALYITYILKDGRQTKAYHIPGRGASVISKYVRTTSFTENDLISDIKAGTTYDVLLSANNTRTIPNNVLDEALAINSNARWFQFYGTNDNPANISNLGYWENQSEIYDDNSNWDVYSLDANGLPVYSTTLRNEKVRHHKMPEAEIKSNTSTTFLNSNQTNYGYLIGLRVMNIPLPAEYKDILAGYKIYWAKKDSTNSLVLANDTAIFNTNLNVLYPNFITNIGSNVNLLIYPKVLNSFLLHDFNAIKNNIDITSASYIKNLGFMTSQLNLVAGSMGPLYSETWLDIDYTNILIPSTPIWYDSTNPLKGSRGQDYIRKIRTSFYLQPNNTDGGDSGLINNSGSYNTTNDIYHYQNDTSIFVEVDNALTSSYYNFTGGAYPTNEDRSLFFLMAYKEDVHTSFDNQQVVDVGIYISLSGLSGYYTDSSAFMGGDTFYNYQTYRSTINFIDIINNSYTDKHTFRNISVVPHLSRANVKFRHTGSDSIEIYYPKSTAMSVLALSGEYDNYYGYNNDYSKVNDILQPVLQSNITAVANSVYPTRIIRSSTDNVDGLYDNLLQFPVNNYKDLDKNRGQIEVIKRDNIGLIINLTNSFTKSMARDVLKTDLTTAYIGNGDIFSTPTKEIIYTDTGIGGTKSQWANIVTPFGYIFPDFKNRKIIQFAQDYNEISSNGMILFFNKYIPFKLLEQFPDIDFINIDNPANPNGLGFVATWDNQYKRYILTKRDYVMSPLYESAYLGEYSTYPTSPVLNDTIWYIPEQKFKFWAGSSWGNMDLNNPIYFLDKGWTISYYPELKSWFSFYDYKPLYYLYDQNSFHSLIDNVFWKHNVDNVSRCLYYDSYTSQFIVDVPFNDTGNKAKIFNSVNFISKYYDQEFSTEYVDRTFSQYSIYSSQGLTPLTNIVNMDTARLVNGTWYINDFRDCRISYEGEIINEWTINYDNADINKNKLYKRRFVDNWIVLRLIQNYDPYKKLGLIFNSAKAYVSER